MTWVNVAIAAGSAIAGVAGAVGSKAAGDAQARGARGATQDARDARNMAYTAYEPNRMLGYQAGADLSNPYIELVSGDPGDPPRELVRVNVDKSDGSLYSADDDDTPLSVGSGAESTAPNVWRPLLEPGVGGRTDSISV